MFSHVTHITPLAAIRRMRLLPVKGVVLVRAGQKVDSTEVIAQANLNPEHIVIDVARGLGVSSKDVSNFMKREVGEGVEEGATIASRGSLVPRVVRAPLAGKLVTLSGGQVMLEVRNQPFNLKAGLPGVVVKVEPDFGGVIETEGAWVQGVWGNEKINSGTLHVLADEPDHVLSEGEIDITMRGFMVLAGHCSLREPLEAGVDVPIRGLILGSLATHLLPLASRMPYPIIIIEGFGFRPMNQVAHTLLSTNESRDVTINAESSDRFTGQRPEVIIPLKVTSAPAQPMDVVEFSPGQKVRILCAPHASEVGIIELIPPGLTTFPNGLKATGALVEMEDGGKVVVPLANIEVLG
jgi:hypothetical protein